MAVAMFMHWPGITANQYDAVMARLELDAKPAAGGVLHVAALTEEGLEVCDVWQTEQAFQGFLQRRFLPVASELELQGERYSATAARTFADGRPVAPAATVNSSTQETSSPLSTVFAASEAGWPSNVTDNPPVQSGDG